MLGTSARLLRLLSLFQVRRYWSGAELSARLEITGRTLRRDVDRLRSLGYPVHSTSGAAGGYQLGAGSTLPPLLLDDNEAVAVAISLRTAASGTVSGIEEASVSALLKLEQVLPSRLSRRVADLHSSILPLENRGTRVDLKALSSIAGACREKVILRFRYAGKDAEPRMRSVEPHRLVHTGWRWYLAAWDLNRKDWRTFRVDRMGGKFSTGAHFKLRPAPDGDFAAYVSRSVSFTRFPRQARVTLHAPLELIAKKLPPGAGTLESIDEQRCRLQTGARSLEMIAVGLALLGVDFEVHDPPELTELMLRMAERLHNAAKRRADA